MERYVTFLTDKAISLIRDYCIEHITDFAERASLALTKMGTERIPLDRADFKLAYEIYDCALDWCNEHDCVDHYEEIDAEEILYIN